MPPFFIPFLSDFRLSFGRVFQIFSDFDGTITQQDSLKILFEEFIGKEWTLLGAKMHRCELSEREALELGLRHMPISLAEARRWLLQRVKIDPSFPEFVRWANFHKIPLHILSGGLKPFLKDLLGQVGLSELDFVANDIIEEEKSWQLCPASVDKKNCEKFAHCKCASIQSLKRIGKKIIYIGDGWTDRCPVKIADLIFAKASLINYCRDNQLPFVEFQSFAEVQAYLNSWIKTYTHRQEKMIEASV